MFKSRKNILIFSSLIVLLLTATILLVGATPSSLPVGKPIGYSSHNISNLNSQSRINDESSRNKYADIDFGPYMRTMQRKIKLYWDPPKGTESKRVVLLYKIDRNGNVLSNKIYQSSGIKEVDLAALQAVYKAAPFGKLPEKFKGQSVDIKFTFDYNVFGATKKDEE